jgi:ATP-dependent DNA helicase RecQ
MKNLEVDGIVVREGRKYQRTPRPFTHDAARIEAITALRRKEQEEMVRYGTLTAGCRMVFLGQALDDPDPAPCGICDLCTGTSLASSVDPALAGAAAQFLRRRPVVIAARKQWPDRKAIPADHQIEDGRALCRWGDGGWSELVKRGTHDRHFDEQLVAALVELVRGWHPEPFPTWVTWVPSLSHPDLVPDLATRLAAELALPAIAAVTQVRPTAAQKGMQNSAQQLANLLGAFSVGATAPTGPALLVDDIVESRWTMTYVGHLLRRAGCEAVLPLALADGGQS